MLYKLAMKRETILLLLHPSMLALIKISKSLIFLTYRLIIFVIMKTKWAYFPPTYSWSKQGWGCGESCGYQGRG